MQHTPYMYYIALNRLIGLCNFGLNAETGRLLLDDVPSIVYCLLLNIAYMLLLPIVFGLLVETAYRCELGLVSLVFNVIASAKLWSVVLVLIGAWLHRRRLHWICNQYMSLLRQYQHRWNSCVQQVAAMRCRCLLKLAMSSARFLMVIVQLYGQNSAMDCMNEGLIQLPNSYVVCSLFMLLMELLLHCVDFTVYASAAIAHLLLQFMWQDAQDLIRDVQLAAKSTNRERQVWAAWLQLCRRYTCLDRMFDKLLHSFEWQLLITLFSRYLAGISVLFRISLYEITFDEDNFSVWLYLLDLSIFVAIYADIFLSFVIFDTIKVQWQLLLEQFWHLSLVVQPPTAIRHTPGMPQLSRQLELTMLLLGRKVHNEPQRIRRLHVAGLFDMSNGTAFGMLTSMLINWLILCQLAVKEYT